jgi:phosphoglycerate kinase
MTTSAPKAPVRTLDDADVFGKRVLVRVDLNVPMEGGKVTDATRIERVLPTIREIAGKGGKVIVLSHLGRPKGRDMKHSLRPVGAELMRQLGKPVAFADDCAGESAARAVAALQPGEILMLENTRFHPQEEANDPGFAAELAKLGDSYVNDAFSAAHRAHASTEGVAHLLPAFAGRTLQTEVEMLTRMASHPARPVTAIVGGSKISTKLELLGNLMHGVDHLFIGGGMANTFLAASGKPVGKSLCETDLADIARKIMADARAAHCEIVLPPDAIVAKKLAPHVHVRACGIDEVADDEMILDIGPRSIAKVVGLLAAARTLVWNGPVGAFEVPPFDIGTIAIAKVAALLTRSGALASIAGGGDTIAALNSAGVMDDLTYVSTAGGAFLEWLEGKSLPGVEALRNPHVLAPAQDAR